MVLMIFLSLYEKKSMIWALTAPVVYKNGELILKWMANRDNQYLLFNKTAKTALNWVTDLVYTTQENRHFPEPILF